MMWAVLAAALAAVFLLGGAPWGAPGSTPGDGGGLAPDRTCGGPNLPQTGREKRPDRPKETEQDRPSGKKKPRPTFCPDGACWSWDAGCSPAAGGGGAVPQKAPDRRTAPAPGGRGPRPGGRRPAVRPGQRPAGAIWQPVTRVFHVKDGWVRVEVDFERTEPALYGRVSLSPDGGRAGGPGPELRCEGPERAAGGAPGGPAADRTETERRCVIRGGGAIEKQDGARRGKENLPWAVAHSMKQHEAKREERRHEQWKSSILLPT